MTHPPELQEQQHPCDDCGEPTDESELQHVVDEEEGEELWLCEECRKRHEAEQEGDEWKNDPDESGE